MNQSLSCENKVDNKNEDVISGNNIFAVVLDLCSGFWLTTLKVSFPFEILEHFLSNHSIRIWIIITRMILNMKNNNQISANLKLDDLGRELIKEESREAKTRKPVMAPINRLLKSLISI